MQKKYFLTNLTYYFKKIHRNQVVIAQWIAQQLAIGNVQGSNPGKGEN